MTVHSPQEEQNKPFMNNPNVRPVPVIASFNTDGNMIPIYFCVETIRIKVDKIIWAKDDLTWGAHFKCEVCPDGYKQEIELMYYSSRKMWVLKK